MAASAFARSLSVPSFMDHAATAESDANSERPRHHRRKTSAAHNVLMREIIRPWGALPATPPGCQAVSYSSWTRFSSTESSPRTPEEMTASVLWAASGTTPDYDPPLLERAYLGVDQPVPCGNPGAVRPQRPQRPQLRKHQRQYSGSTSSWATTSSSSPLSSQTTSTPIAFGKEEVKSSPASTSSLLTVSFKSSPLSKVETQQPNVTDEMTKVHADEPVVTEETAKAEKQQSILSEKMVKVEDQHPMVTVEMAKEYGISVLSISRLPDACCSDTEEEEEE